MNTSTVGHRIRRLLLSLVLAGPSVGGLAHAGGGEGSCGELEWIPTVGDPGPDSAVRAMAVFDDGSGSGPALYVGGDFTTAGGVTVNHIARWDGTTWSAVGSGMNGIVRALAVYDDGGPSGPALFAGGNFAFADGLPANYIARWDGSNWTPVRGGPPSIGGGTNAAVYALTVFDDGSGAGPALYVGGDFTSAGGQTTNRIARWDGDDWTPLGSGLNSGVRAMTVLEDDNARSVPELYVGGYFTTADGASADHIARWDGNAWSAVGEGMNFGVIALTVFDDGIAGPAVYAGGGFTEPAEYIARWDGAAWSSPGGGMNSHVNTLAVFDDGTGSGPALYAGGAFMNAGGVAASRIARWDGSDWSPLGGGMINPVTALGVFDDGGGMGPALYAGGWYLPPAGGSYLARWGCTTMLPPPVSGDINGDGFVGIDDLLAMLQAWGPCLDCEDCPADLNGDCMVTIADLLLLLQWWP